MSTVNGSAGASDDPLTHILDELKGALVQYDAEVEQAQAVLDAAKDQRTRVRKTITMLAGEQPKSKSSARRRQRASEEVLSIVLAALSAEPTTVTQIVERTGLTADQARSGLQILREREQVRLLGRASTIGGPKTYALMPNG